jgi:hypothetical protein
MLEEEPDYAYGPSCTGVLDARSVMRLVLTAVCAPVQVGHCQRCAEGVRGHGKPIQVRPCPGLARALVTFTFCFFGEKCVPGLNNRDLLPAQPFWEQHEHCGVPEPGRPRGLGMLGCPGTAQVVTSVCPLWASLCLLSCLRIACTYRELRDANVGRIAARHDGSRCPVLVLITRPAS